MIGNLWPDEKNSLSDRYGEVGTICQIKLSFKLLRVFNFSFLNQCKKKIRNRKQI